MTTDLHMLTPATLPLNKLVPWQGNVRKTSATGEAMTELMASIAPMAFCNRLS